MSCSPRARVSDAILDQTSNSSQGSKKLVDPTTMLLPEILSEIFVKCLPEDLNRTGRVDEAPVNVSQVNRSWREIALSTTKLWSTLVFFVGKTDTAHSHPTPDNGRQNMTVDAWKLWCGRSKGQPLSVFLRRTEGKFDGDIRRYFSIICSLDKETRWKELCLSLPHNGDDVRVLALSPESFGQLEVLCLTNLFITFDPEAPYTKCISEEDDFKELTGQVVTVPSRLRVLDVEMRMPEQWITNSDEYDAFDYSSMMSILNGASSYLSHFGFSISARLFIFRDSESDFGHVTLPNLRTMKLSDNVYAAAFFLDHITAPALETLWLSFRREMYWGDMDMDMEGLDSITGFLTRSKAPITDLKVCIDGFDGEDIREILRLVPQVQHLRMDVKLGGLFGTTDIADHAISFFRDLQTEGICKELVTVYVNLRLANGLGDIGLGNIDAQAGFLFTIPFPLTV